MVKYSRQPAEPAKCTSLNLTSSNSITGGIIGVRTAVLLYLTLFFSLSYSGEVQNW